MKFEQITKVMYLSQEKLGYWFFVALNINVMNLYLALSTHTMDFCLCLRAHTQIHVAVFRATNSFFGYLEPERNSCYRYREQKDNSILVHPAIKMYLFLQFVKILHTKLLKLHMLHA